MNSKHRRTLPSDIKKPHDVEMVADTLIAAREHGLEAEVMWSALTMAAEANEHGLTMEQVLEAALGEWDI
jgi:predicted transcriptional regulator